NLLIGQGTLAKKSDAMKAGDLIACVQAKRRALPIFWKADLGLAGLDFADHWTPVRRADGIEATERVARSAAIHKRPSTRLPNDKLLSLEHTQCLAQGAETHPKLAMQIDLAGQNAAGPQRALLDTNQELIANEQIKRAHSKIRWLIRGYARHDMFP